MTRIREAVLADHAAIARLEKRHGLFSLAEPEWRRRWSDNPALADSPHPWPMGWVIETGAEADSTIVGFFGNIPMAYTFQDTKILAAATNSWVVDEAYRNQAMALLSRFMKQASVGLLISTTANAATSKAMTALRARRVPQPDCDTTQFWITAPYKFARALARKRQIPFPALFGTVAGVAAQVASCLRTAGAGQLPKNYRLSIVTEFDDRFDDLWRAQAAASQGLQRVRDKKTLAWQFRRFLEKDRAWIVTCETPEPAALLGYAICVRQDNPEIGLSRAVLVDFQALDTDQRVLESLLRAALSESRKRQLATFESLGHAPDKRRVIASLKPFTRSLPTWPYLYKANDRSLAGQLAAPDAWDICASDGDACL